MPGNNGVSGRQEGVHGTPGQGSRAAPMQNAIPRMAPLRQPANLGPEASASDGDGHTGSSRRSNGWQGGQSSLQDVVGLQAVESSNSHSRSAPPVNLPLEARSSPDQPEGHHQQAPAGAAPSARSGLTSSRYKSIRLMTPDASASGSALTSASELRDALAEPGRQEAPPMERTLPPAGEPEAQQPPALPRTGEEAEFSVEDPSDSRALPGWQE
jgi:hypothetical protein